MKKASRKIFAVLMTVLMIVSAVSVSAFAYDRNGSKVQNVVVMGDSIAAGFSLPDYKSYGQYCLQNTRVKGSYGDLVAKSLKIKKANYTPYVSPGFRTKELRVLVEDGYQGDFVTQNFIGSLSGNENYSLQVMEEQRPEVQQTVSNADMVILEIGFNDTWLTTMGAFTDYSMTTNDPIGRIFNSPRYIYELEQAIYDTLLGFGNEFAAIVNDIYTLNPDVTLVVVGCYNPFKDWTVPDGSGLYLGQLLNFLYNNMNSSMRAQATAGRDYVFVDVPDTEVISNTVNDLLSGVPMLQEGGWDPHPTEAGHQYIADQILAALNA